SCLRVTILFLPDPHSRRIRIGKIDHDATQALARPVRIPHVSGVPTRTDRVTGPDTNPDPETPTELDQGSHGSWCGPGVDGGGVLGEGDIPDVVRGIFHSPVPANRGGQVGRAGLVGVEAGDGVDTLMRLTPAGLLAAVDADGQAGVGKGDSAEFVGNPATASMAFTPISKGSALPRSTRTGG
ncbi:hypothetical protein, partial [Streptomyces sp. NPDC006285]|uniref:hypothetical protein n=1 Tax=Streptomyces sp. NPDC006285 TaxID=3364742 RepID=UPI00368CE742